MSLVARLHASRAKRVRGCRHGEENKAHWQHPCDLAKDLGVSRNERI